MAAPWRTIAFGLTVALVAAGVICVAAIDGLAGQLLAIALITAGLGGALLLIFVEIGLSEDRERARQEKHRRERAPQRPNNHRRHF